MKTLFALLALYDGLPVIPAERVCADFFAPLTFENFLRKTLTAEIQLPVMRMYDSERAAKGVHINDLAEFLDKIAAAARKERDQLRWSKSPPHKQAQRPERPRLPQSAPVQDRARWGYVEDKTGNYRHNVAGLRAGQVRVTAPDGRKWVEDTNELDPPSWKRKRHKPKIKEAAN